MPSRRQVLSTLVTAQSVGFAGCSGFDSDRFVSGSSSGGTGTIDCHSRALSHGDGDVLDSGARATVEDDDVRLVVPLSVETVKEQSVDRLTIYDAAGEVASVVPVSPEDADVMANKSGVGNGTLRYEQYLGHRPLHGQYKIVAVNRAGTQVDSLTIEFNCFADVEE